MDVPTFICIGVLLQQRELIPSGLPTVHSLSLTQLSCFIVLSMLGRRRTSTDIRNTYGSFMENAQTVAPFAATNRTGPGCWAYVSFSVVHRIASHVRRHRATVAELADS